MPSVNVYSHHSPRTGKLYYPGQRWGIHYEDESTKPTYGGPLGSDCARNKSQAFKKAMNWCSKEGRSATVFRREDGEVVMRYWRDSIGLQHLKP